MQADLHQILKERAAWIDIRLADHKPQQIIQSRVTLYRQGRASIWLAMPTP